MGLYSADGGNGEGGGGVVFVNLVDKKKDQGALGETFDAALKAVKAGAGREPVTGGNNSNNNKNDENNNHTRDNGLIDIAPRGPSALGEKTETDDVPLELEDRASELDETDGGTTGRERREDGGGDGLGFDLDGSLRHVWFDFHHEVRVLGGGR